MYKLKVVPWIGQGLTLETVKTQIEFLCLIKFV